MCNKYSFPLSFSAFIFALLFGASFALAQSPVMRAGDKVELRLGGVPPSESGVVSGTYTIDPEGFINLSHVGKVKAAGLQQHELQEVIEARYRTAEIYTNPTIVVNHLTGSLFVNLDGEVRSRGRRAWTPDMTLLTAITAAGGVSEYADQKRVQLSRDGKIEYIDIRRIRRDPGLDVPVQPGDNIFIPRSFW